MMYDICTVGHITLDKVVTDQLVKHMPGGTSFYFSKALRHFPINYALVTALAETEYAIVDDLRLDGANVYALPSDYTVFFENIYRTNQDHRDQNVHHTASSFKAADMPAISAKIFHLGPLLVDDISGELVKKLAATGLVSLDIQGFLRYVLNKKVHYRDWAEKAEILPYVNILKANELEMEVITGTTDPHEGAKLLADLGVKEVIITLGSKGSLVYTDDRFYTIPAFKPTAVVDATGCGDTYMAGYLWKKVNGASVQEAGEFGAAMATLKIESSGPFGGTAETVETILKQGSSMRIVPDMAMVTSDK